VSGGALENSIGQKWGGDLRVKDITLQKEGKVLSHYRYDYSDNALSSGVATQEPGFCKGVKRAVEDIYRYPSPAVTYGKVTRFQIQPDGTSADEIWVSKFITANQNTVTVSRKINEHNALNGSPPLISANPYELRQAAYEITYRDDQIGLATSVEKLNPQSQTVTSEVYTYEPATYGSFTQGLHLMDNTYRAYSVSPGDIGRNDKRMSYRFINSIIVRSPLRLKSGVSRDTKTGISQSLTHLNQDFYTGEPTQIVSLDSYGHTRLKETVPAYHPYAGMGPAWRGGKNRLNEVASSTSYTVDASLQPTGLLSAIIQTWSNAVPALDQASGIWAAQSTYQWNGTSSLNKDGTYPIADFKSHPFHWMQLSNNTHWEKVQETKLCNSYAKALVVEDVNGNQTATRMTPDQRRVIATATHAAYGEMAGSGAEYYAGNAQPEGGVGRGEGTPSTAHRHTGRYSLLVGNNNQGFTYTLQPGQADLSKRYRASVWVYVPGAGETQVELDKIQLTYSVNGAEKGSVHPVLQKSKSKSWYLLNLDVVPAGNGAVAITCHNKSSRGVYFDDFRVHLLDASLTTYVYDNFSGELSYLLDANNFYTYFEYDAMGRLLRTSRELLNFDFGDGKESYRADKVLSEVEYHYGRTK
jgi:hypothetical protein